jgi:hypothetical protein
MAANVAGSSHSYPPGGSASLFGLISGAAAVCCARPMKSSEDGDLPPSKLHFR